ncbi:putative retrotransposon [Apostichopus japonicus]|uniref:Putative retrotransposon n=1 Tax=Stichopus japonicus TaxID=307972 RepID=A0A2G8KVI9_STIJA|nr:putative retrotransposon [Apostichopus japonicus]
MEKIKLEKEIRLEQQKQEQELELKRLESETHLKELEIQAKYKSESDSSPSSSAHRSQPYFDASRYIKLVPKFTEIEVDKYFRHFEKVAANMKWPKEVWTLLLQSSFVGKAREVYSALPMEKSENYDEVKQAILKAYELVPEAYRQKFRGARKNDNQTHVEFARIKEQMFDRWLHSKDVGENFVKLRQLFLIEEFKRCIHPDIKTHIDERMIDTLHAAATKADDYALTHKLSPNKFYQARSQKPKINTVTE